MYTGVYGGQKRESDGPRNGFEVVVSKYVDAGNQTWVLRKKTDCIFSNG